MSDTTILYAGVFCFALTLLGLALTIHEFKKMSRSRNMLFKPEPMKSPLEAAAKVSASLNR
jgi:hypothetical protein